MYVFINTTKNPIEGPKDAKGVQGPWFEPGRNELPAEYIDGLGKSGQRTLEKLFLRGQLKVGDEAELPEPAPEPPKPEEITLDIMLDEIADCYDVAGLDELFAKDPRPEIAEAITLRMSELDKMSEAEIKAALENPPPKRGRGRPKGSKNKKTLEREAAAAVVQSQAPDAPSV